VILLDEPSNSLDEAGIEVLHSVLDDATRNGKSVVWCAPTLKQSGITFDVVHELAGGSLSAV
jgi:ABC-type cobalamin transport system ATPase subunit